MSKRLFSVMALVMVAAMLLTACGNPNAATEGEDASTSDAATTEKVDLTFGTGGTQGTYYAVGGTMATVLNNVMEGVNLTVVSTGASKANILDIDDGLSDLAIVQNDVMDYAANGTDLFAEDGAFSTFKAVAGVYDETCQVIAVPGIESIEDLRGKTVNVGDAGSGVEFNATQILAAYGIDINEDINKVNGSFGDAADSIKDGKIDAAFITAGAPTTAVVDLSIARDMVLVEIDDEHADMLMEQYPFYTKTTIPGGTYNGVDADVQTLSVRATIIASETVSEDAIYEFTKAMFENQESLKTGHAKFEELVLEEAVQGITVDFHAGAQKYYEEAGVL